MINNSFRSFPYVKAVLCNTPYSISYCQTSFNLEEKQDNELEKYRVFDTVAQLKTETEIKIQS